MHPDEAQTPAQGRAGRIEVLRNGQNMETRGYDNHTATRDVGTESSLHRPESWVGLGRVMILALAIAEAPVHCDLTAATGQVS